MQKHAMALGYFFLAVFCLFTSAHMRTIPGLHFAMLISAIVAAIVGFVFFCSTLSASFRACKEWLGQATTSLIEAIHEAQKPPIREPIVPKEHTSRGCSDH